MLNGNQDRYPKHYQKTDIFNLSPLATPQRRAQVDRNKSSVFGTDAAPTQTPRKDHMASDIFFGGNTTQKFGGYEPSFSQKSSVSQLREEERFREAERAALEAAEIAAYRKQEEAARKELEDARYAQDQDSVAYQQGKNPVLITEYQPDEDLYHQTEAELYSQSGQEVYQPERLISNVFEDQQSYTRGSRRHFQSGQQTSDIFFQNEAPPPRQYVQEAYQTESSSSYRPSVKMSSSHSSSYSNIFGDGDGSSNVVSEKLMSNHELDRVSGLSSGDLNKDKRGRGRRGVTTSQIFF